MKYLKLQSYDSELTISRIATGSSSRIAKIPEEELFRIFDRYVEAGGNCFDSARGYYGGKSELLIGKWQKSRGIRERINLCTKAGNALDPRAADAWPRLKYEELKGDLEESLAALQTDYIDLFWLHRDDPHMTVEEIVDNVNSLIRGGHIRAAAVSNWTPERIEAANRYAAESWQCGFLASQIRWSLGEQNPGTDPEKLPIMDRSAYDWYVKSGLPVFAFSSQAQGFFAKAAAGGVASLSEGSRRVYDNPANLERLERVKTLAAEKGVSVSSAVLGYIIYNRADSVAVITSSNVGQLEDSLGAVGFDMTADEADWLWRG